MMYNVGTSNSHVALVAVNSAINKQKRWNKVQEAGGAGFVNWQRMRATNLPPGVTEDDGLGNRQCIVQVAEGVEFPFLLLHRDEELFDTLGDQLVTLDEDTNWVGHEFGRHLQNVVREGSAQQDDLCGRWKVSVNLINLVLETPAQQIVRLIEYKHLDVPRPKTPPPNHIENPTGCARHDVLPILEFANILADRGTVNTRVALDVHVATQSEDDRLDLSPKFSGRRQDECLGLPNSDIDGLED